MRSVALILALIPFWLSASEQLLVDKVLERSWIVDRGDQMNRVGLHRYRNPDISTQAVLFYLPGTNMHGDASILDENHNLWLFLANRGVEVYAMDYRTHFVPHDAEDIEFMKDWTIDVFVNDAQHLLNNIESDKPLFVSGFSRGASYAYMLAGLHEFAGLIAFDGSFKAYEQKAYDYQSAMATFAKRGDYASVLSRRGYDKRRKMMLDAVNHPNGPALNDKYENAGEYLASTLHNAWGPGVLANTVDQLTPVAILGLHMADFDWFFPKIQNIQGRSMASQSNDPNSTLDDHWGQMTLPVLYFGSSNFGADSVINGLYSAARSGSKDVSFSVLEGYGHTDVLTATKAREDVYQVTLDWVLARSSQ